MRISKAGTKPILGGLAKTETAFSSRRVDSHDSLDERAFHRTISAEQRRANRSHKSFLLLLLDIGGPTISKDDQLTLGRIQSALSLKLRETDVVGWYEEGCVVGIIFTEIASHSKSSLPAIVTARVREIVKSCIPSREFDRLSVSFHLSAEERVTEPVSQGSRSGAHEYGVTVLGATPVVRSL